MFQTLFYSAAALYAGIILSDKLYSLSPVKIFIYAAFFIFTPLVVCVLSYIIKKMKVEILFLVPLCFIAGIYSSGLRSDKNLCPLSKYENKEISVCGTVCSNVIEYETGSSFILDVKYVVVNGEKSDISGKIKASSPDVPKTGTEVILCGELTPIKEKLNSTSFDRREKYIKSGIFYSVFSKTAIISGEIPKLTYAERLSFSYITAVNKYVDSAFDRESAAFLKGMLLRNKSEIPEETLESMLHTGLYRYIWCPYLHISVLLMILGYIVKERKKKVAATVVVVLMYLYLNAAVSTAWKLCLFIALSTFLTYERGLKSKKEALLLTLILTGIFSPFTLLEGGFILSCICTAAAILIAKLKFSKATALRGAIFYGAMIIVSSPIAAEFGYAITPYSFILSAVIIPLIFLCYILFGISALIYAAAGNMLSLGIPIVLNAIVRISRLTEILPFANISVKPRGLLFDLSFYTLAFAMYLLAAKHKKEFAVFAAASVALIVPYCAEEYINRDVAEVIFVNVGQGDCSVIKLPHGKTIMVDGGGSASYSTYDVGSAEVMPMLRKNGVEKVEAVILSHYDKDHADGIVTVMDNLEVGEIFMPDYLPNTPYRDIIESKAAETGTRVHYINSSCAMSVADVLVKFIYSDFQKNSDNDNDKSLIAKVSYGNTSVLYTGDISRLSELGIEKEKCDILKIPHHGSKSSTSEHLLRNTMPAFCVFCLGEDNVFDFPNKLVVDRCINSGCKLYRTDKNGDIHFYADKMGIKRIYCFKGA